MRRSCTSWNVRMKEMRNGVWVFGMKVKQRCLIGGLKLIRISMLNHKRLTGFFKLCFHVLKLRKEIGGGRVRSSTMSG